MSRFKEYFNKVNQSEQQICILFENNYYESASLSRAFQHVSNIERGGIFCSAYRSDESDETNKLNHNKLGAMLSERKIGHWEVLGKCEERDEKGNIVSVEAEPSYVIPYDPKMSSEQFLDLAREIREMNYTTTKRKSNTQYEVLIKLPGEKTMTSIKAEGIEKLNFEFHADAIAKYYSQFLNKQRKHKGRSFNFIFEGVLIASDMSQARAMHRNSKYGSSINSQYGICKLNESKIVNFYGEDY